MCKTEIIPETLNPKFMKTCVVSYNINKNNRMKFEVYDIDNFENKDKLRDQKYIGYATIEINDLVVSSGQ